MTQIRVKSIVVEDKLAVFYLEDGSTFTVNQGEARLARMIEKAIPIIKAGEIAVLDTEEGTVGEPVEGSTIFSGFEQRSGGFMKFFRAAKDAVKKIFHTHQDDYSNAPAAPKVPLMAIMPTVFEESAKPQEQVDKGMYAPVDTPTDIPEDKSAPVTEEELEIKSEIQVKPLTSDVVTKNETVVAVLPNGRMIPGMENLKSHLNHAKDPDQIEGLKRFVERMSVMLDKRAHSVEDLLNFMQRGDMPVTINGDIIAYKVLNHYKGNKTSGRYVDKHSGKVIQRVGSFVNVREDLVDKDRRNECSNGLHVARHGYLYAGSFTAHKCFIILVAPEDVVTVPHRDADKVRTMGYHVVAELPDEAYELIKKRRPITEIPAMKALLAEIIKGNHVPRLESVQINGQYGADLKITPLGTREERLAWKFESTATEEEIQKAEAVTLIEEKAAQIKEQEKAAVIDVKDLAKKVEQAPAESYQQRVLRALAEKDEAFVLDVVTKKRKAKKSWDSLGLTALIGEQLVTFLKDQEKPVEEPKQQIADEVPQAPEVKQDAAKVEPVPVNENTFYAKVVKALTKKDATLASELVAQKRKAKKSWTSYGVSDKAAEDLIQLAGTASAVITTEPPVPEPVKEEPKVNRIGFQKTEEGYVPLPIGSMQEFKEALAVFEQSPNKAQFDRLKAFAKSKKKSLLSLGISHTVWDLWKDQ
ncbi:rIIB protector from prophage-induced early lysis protein [Rhizobium phage RHph_I1_6]|uniref:RIIB protector from prophage-induced early lysis protein n=1 Tax=Rhizobium phage RHph_I1_6 TaxID=2509728 RepID=A0A7S5RFK6_9CAUD|nr:RIIB lysis inhibitor [Rhizobium phage RHph_I1_6]QIG76577.1 rIIB protector from prophage-induced early lysis protein [Rhizobium phage RHph_I1_6]